MTTCILCFITTKCNDIKKTTKEKHNETDFTDVKVTMIMLPNVITLHTLLEILIKTVF